jgi:hypothetical protein
VKWLIREACVTPLALAAVCVFVAFIEPDRGCYS